MPRRSAIDPTQVLNLMPRLFMLGRQGPGQYQFRLVGDFITKVHEKNLRGMDFLGLWRTDDRISLQMAMEAVRRRGEPLVIECDGRAQAATALRLEIALAPIANTMGAADRFLGLYQPISPLIGLAGRAIFSLAVNSLVTPDSDEGSFPRLRLATVYGANAR